MNNNKPSTCNVKSLSIQNSCFILKNKHVLNSKRNRPGGLHVPSVRVMLSIAASIPDFLVDMSKINRHSSYSESLAGMPSATRCNWIPSGIVDFLRTSTLTPWCERHANLTANCAWGEYMSVRHMSECGAVNVGDWSENMWALLNTVLSFPMFNLIMTVWSVHAHKINHSNRL